MTQNSYPTWEEANEEIERMDLAGELDDALDYLISKDGGRYYIITEPRQPNYDLQTMNAVQSAWDFNDY